MFPTPRPPPLRLCSAMRFRRRLARIGKERKQASSRSRKYIPRWSTPSGPPLLRISHEANIGLIELRERPRYIKRIDKSQ